MDVFERQQTIEIIKTVVKARWFYVLGMALQGLIMKLAFPGVPLASSGMLSLVIGSVLFVNFCFWLYLRRSPEKIKSLMLRIIKFSQVPLELFGLVAIFYFSGTANKLLLMMFIIPIIVGSTLYKTKGVIFITLSTIFLYSGLVVLEYLGLMPDVSSEVANQSTLKLLKGQLSFVKAQLISFNLYILGAAFYAGYLSGLLKRREKKLESQKDELIDKTQKLTHQTQELTKTRDYLHEALSKSDKARVEVEKTKTELQKMNLELQAKINELEKYGQVTTGRELRMIELKEEIKNLRETVENLKSQLALNK
jgi:hypothetical protein